MKREQLFEAIGSVSEEQLESSEKECSRRRPWVKYGTAAACFGLLAVGLYALVKLGVGGIGAGFGASNGSGHDGDSSVFMSYAGPVFPLTTLGEEDGITAARNIALDFLPWTEPRSSGYYPADILVTDNYTITNQTMEDKVIQVAYPFASSLWELDRNLPVLTADGAEIDTGLLIGGYPGGFQGASGEGENGNSADLVNLTSWEKYKVLLEDGSYLDDAFSYSFGFSELPVIVYSFTDEYGPEPAQDIPNPTIRAMFQLDFEKTKVLSYGFNQSLFDWKQNIMGLGFSIRRPGEIAFGETRYIIVIGDDIRDLETTGYVTGGWGEKQTLENTGVAVTKEEMTLGTVLKEIAAKQWEIYLKNSEDRAMGTEPVDTLDFETYYQIYCSSLEKYGVLVEKETGRGDNDLESLDVDYVQRVCYLTAQVEIPAGESIVLAASMVKEASYDYSCAHTENQGVYGYDMMTKLGTKLSFTSSFATIEDHGRIEIVRQNFGFDLTNDVKTVQLAPEEEHYYLEVKEKK